MNFVSGNKIGQVLNIMINGSAYTKKFDTEKEALDVFKKVIAVSENPTNEGITELRYMLVKPVNVPVNHLISTDKLTNKFYFKDTTFELPKELVDVICDYIQNGLPLNSIENFTELLVTNPNLEVHADLFKFLYTYHFSITKYGYFLGYKAVKIKQKVDNNLAEFVSNKYMKIKSWKKSPANYSVLRDLNSELFLVKNDDVKNDSEAKKELVGTLSDLFNNLDEHSNKGTLYTDKYSGTMDIRLGTPVRQDRSTCNHDKSVECSNGLHVGSVKYLENNSFVSTEDTVLLVLVNPQHVVAVPKYDNSKMRVCEYFPIAYLNRTEGRKFETVESKYFEYDYLNYEKSDLEKALAELEEKMIKEDVAPTLDEKIREKILLDRLKKITV